MRRAWAVALILCFGSVIADEFSVGSVDAQNDPHAYFDSLIARADFWKGWSLRPQAGVGDSADPYYSNQLANRDSGGFSAYRTCPPLFTYNPGVDTDPHAQDAAKAPIPAFTEPGGCNGHPIVQAVRASTSGAKDIIHVTAVTSTYGPPGRRQMQIENEILEIRACTPAEGGDGRRGYVRETAAVCVIRGQYGTVATAHSVGIKPKVSSNQINNMLRLPLGTADGNKYLITWDAYYTDSYLGVGEWDSGQKSFQLRDAERNKLFEPRVQFDGGRWPGRLPFTVGSDVGAVDARSYNSVWDGDVSAWSASNGNMLGSGSKNLPVQPFAGQFVIKPNTWTRWWLLLDQRAGDWDPISMWVGDENTDPVKIYDQVKISVERKNPPENEPSISTFDFELGNSQSAWLRGDLRDLVAYFRNFVVLRNPLDVQSLLLRPLAGVAPQSGPAPPPNVHLRR